MSYYNTNYHNTNSANSNASVPSWSTVNAQQQATQQAPNHNHGGAVMSYSNVNSNNMVLPQQQVQQQQQQPYYGQQQQQILQQQPQQGLQQQQQHQPYNYYPNPSAPQPISIPVPSGPTGGMNSSHLQSQPQYQQYQRPPFIDPITNIIYDLDNPDYEGWLTKQSTWMKEWRRRYFLLKGSKLFFCKNDGRTAAAHGMMDLALCTTVKSADLKSKKRHSFEISTPDTTYLLYADNESQKDDWIGRVGKAIVRCSRTYYDSSGNPTTTNDTANTNNNSNEDDLVYNSEDDDIYENDDPDNPYFND